ncbi:hypothetical protein KC345_g5492 [Hortaea werneckii]|nr:hypothetical protein KC345_g5492 [Hortaea werneckii]
MREAQRRVLRRMEEENNSLRLSLRKEQEKSAGLKKNLEVIRNLKHEAQKQQKDLREEIIRGFESQLNDMRTFQPDDGVDIPTELLSAIWPAGVWLSPTTDASGIPTTDASSAAAAGAEAVGGYDQPPPDGNMHHPMQYPMQYPTQPLMHPPPGGHQQSPPAGDQQRQGYQGVEQRDYAQPPPGPLPTPTAASSPLPMQEQMQSGYKGPPPAFGADYEARKKRVMERARAKRSRLDKQ